MEIPSYEVDQRDEKQRKKGKTTTLRSSRKPFEKVSHICLGSKTQQTTLKSSYRASTFQSISELMQALSDLLLNCFKWHLLSNEAASLTVLSGIYCQMRQRHGPFKKFHQVLLSKLCLRRHETCSLRQTDSDRPRELQRASESQPTLKS